MKDDANLVGAFTLWIDADLRAWLKDWHGNSFCIDPEHAKETISQLVARRLARPMEKLPETAEQEAGQ